MVGETTTEVQEGEEAMLLKEAPVLVVNRKSCQGVPVMYMKVNGSFELNLGTEEFSKNMNEYDIVWLSETWTNESSDINVSDFDDQICKHRKRKHGTLRY